MVSESRLDESIHMVVYISILCMFLVMGIYLNLLVMRTQIYLFILIILGYGTVLYMASNGYGEAMNETFSFTWFITWFFLTVGGLSLGAWWHGVVEHYFK